MRSIWHNLTNQGEVELLTREKCGVNKGCPTFCISFSLNLCSPHTLLQSVTRPLPPGLNCAKTTQGSFGTIWPIREWLSDWLKQSVGWTEVAKHFASVGHSTSVHPLFASVNHSTFPSWVQLKVNICLYQTLLQSLTQPLPHGSNCAKSTLSCFCTI